MKTATTDAIRTVKVALPTAQGVRDPEREHSGYAPNGVFITLTSEAIRKLNGQRWLVLQDRYRKRKARTAEATVQGFREALATAQASSLAHRGYGRRAA